MMFAAIPSSTTFVCGVKNFVISALHNSILIVFIRIKVCDCRNCACGVSANAELEASIMPRERPCLCLAGVETIVIRSCRDSIEHGRLFWGLFWRLR